jgi:hypothetical protein
MPMLNQIAQLTEIIEAYDDDLQKLAATKYSDLAPLRTIYAVGALTALTFVLTLGDNTTCSAIVPCASCYTKQNAMSAGRKGDDGASQLRRHCRERHAQIPSHDAEVGRFQL